LSTAVDIPQIKRVHGAFKMSTLMKYVRVDYAGMEDDINRMNSFLS